MKKRFLSLLCVLALCLGLLPVTALAAGEDVPNVLCVGTTNIGTTSYNDNAAYWTSEDGGTTWNSQQTQPEGDSYIYYDGQGTLELHNVTIQGQYDDSHVFGAGIYALCGTNQSVSLTIQLTGNNTITGDFGIYVEAQQGGTLGANASLSITGDGSLTVTGTASYGLYVKSGTGDASLTIKNASVDAKTTQIYSSYAGVCVQSGASATGSPQLSLAVNGGSLTASASEGNDGIQFYVGNSSASATTSLTVSENAIVDARNGGISALKISETLPTPTPTGDNRSGIVFDGSIGTVYGSVTLQDDLEIKSGETLTVPEGSKLDCNNNLTNNGTILASGGTVSGNLSDGKEVTTPSISDQPTNQTVTEGSAAEFSVTASDAQTYQWQQSTDSGSNWTNIESATSAKYTTEATTTSMSGYQYRCVVKSASGVSVISNAATLTVNQSVSPTSYSISADVAPAGAGSVSGGGSYTEGTSVTLTATNNPGYRFVGWVESGTTVSTNPNYTFVANSNRSLTAQFDRISSGGGDSDPTYSITLPSRVTGGELKLSRRYAEKGETVTITAIPDEGYELDTLTVTDSKGNEIDLTHKGGNEYTFKMPAGRVEIEVSFREIAVELPFTDVPEGAWYADAAAYVYEHGLMAGTSATTFAPDATTSRSMIATILWRMAGSPVVNYAMNYTDVAQGQWCSEAIRWAASEGIVGGYGNGLFGTNDPITREQFAAMLYRFAQEQGYDVSIGENTNILSYTDVADLSEYAISAMQWAVGAGIINGTGDGSTLSPQGQATRAQAAVMLMRFCEEYVTW